MPANSSVNFTTPRIRPTAMIQRHPTWGRPMNSAGSAATLNLRAENSSGDRWSSPTSITTKLKPHTAATATARPM
jgi:hypothetical protein